jgi:ABC-type branched-subunit amino acid transport system substrate-binding protein
MENRFILTRPRIRTRMIVALTAASAAVAMTVSATAVAGSSRQAACTGAPIKVETISNISNPAGSQQTPEVPQAVKAAAVALTKSCELGGPIKVIVCDDKFNPNDAAACGRDVVANKPAVVFTYSGFGDSYIPTIAAAGIPIMPLTGVSQQEVTSPLSFPLSSAIEALIGQVNTAASVGRTKMAIAVLDIPSVNFVVQLAEKEAKALGITIVKEIPVPVTATDMTGVAAQVISSGADVVITVAGPAAMVGIGQGVRQQGASSKQVAFVNSMSACTPRVRQTLGAAAHGMLMSGWAWDASDTSKPFVRQMLSELKAAGQPSGQLDITQQTSTAWGAMHMLADALKAAHLPATAANVPKALKQKVVFELSQKWGLNPLDYRSTQFPTDPVLKTLRIFSKYHDVFQVNNSGRAVPLSQQWLGVLHKANLKTVA